ncbi:hypothetical protein [Desulfosporosinus sp. BICA1-9]|uniref:hypothetical protein n=1 Tax=Desulfosporosinus sp. BICA1-9 TaxID=1531958 RepID=UPI00054BA244|nr:hypothetical protein [Desulfosporosinus sp. BICA1-9]KJS46279.1 MAG: hypothetical protein VR66_26470 [Peptococcaceae bacterium BRH_c23]KJS80760.1 MAG: hypothetical protein JL57_27580 [Desulfosporosinus sp. BICA1-9]
MGEEVHSPVIEPGEADIIIAFEQLEAYRRVHFLRQEDVIIAGRYCNLTDPVELAKHVFEDYDSTTKPLRSRSSWENNGRRWFS